MVARAVLPIRPLLAAAVLCFALLPAAARANPATPDETVAMRAEALKSRVNDVRERNLRAKARLFMLDAALKSTRTFASTPEQAIANAAKASPETTPACLAPASPQKDQPVLCAALVR